MYTHLSIPLWCHISLHCQQPPRFSHIGTKAYEKSTSTQNTHKNTMHDFKPSIIGALALATLSTPAVGELLKISGRTKLFSDGAPFNFNHLQNKSQR